MMPIPGYEPRITKGGIGVLRYHYSADSNKRPGTSRGDQWLIEESRAYPMGMDDPRWMKEMEIKYGAMGGQHLFPRWEQWKANGRIVIHPYDPAVGTTRLYASYDHGWFNPASFHVHSVDSDGIITTIWEFYGSKFPVHQIVQIIKGYPGISDDGVRWDGCPYFCNIGYIVADPSMWNEDKPQATGPNKSTAAIFRELGVSMLPGERGGDLTVAEWLHGWFWKDPMNPRYRITSNCPKLIWEIGQQRRKEFSSQVAIRRNQPEELIDKDNHAWDDLKYFLKRFPPPERKKLAEATGNTFFWWKKQIQRQAEGRPIRTYHRAVM